MILENGFLIKTVDGMTEEMFFDLCQANSELRMERDQHGNISIMSPMGLSSGNYHSKIIAQLWLWSDRTQLGQVFDSSAGYTLPNGAVRSPDVSWLTNGRWESLSEEEQRKFAHICPDFVVEVRSETDRLNDLKSKMEEYRTNGCRLGWLIDRKGKAVYIYRADGSIETTQGEPMTLSGEDVLPGFVLELSF